MGRNTGDSMSGHLQFSFASLVLIAGLSTSPASSNPFAALFNAAPAEAAPASAEDECLPRPGKSTADGQHWVYRLDGHRKCWFQVAAGTARVKKAVRHQGTKHRVAAPEENVTARRKGDAIVDARAELRSAPAETSQPTPPAPALKVVDAALVLATGAAALEPPASIAKLANEQLHDHSTPSQVEGQTLLTGSAGCQPRGCGLPVAFPIAEASDDGPRWTAIWFGVLLMALGLVSVLSASRTLRRTLLLGDGCDGVGWPWRTTNSGTVFQLRSNMFKRVVTKPERLKAVVSSPSTAAGPRRPGGDGVQNQKTAHFELEKVRGNRDDRPHRPRGAPATHPTLQRA